MPNALKYALQSVSCMLFYAQKMSLQQTKLLLMLWSAPQLQPLPIKLCLRSSTAHNVKTFGGGDSLRSWHGQLKELWFHVSPHRLQCAMYQWSHRRVIWGNHNLKLQMSRLPTGIFLLVTIITGDLTTNRSGIHHETAITTWKGTEQTHKKRSINKFPSNENSFTRYYNTKCR